MLQKVICFLCQMCMRWLLIAISNRTNCCSCKYGDMVSCAFFLAAHQVFSCIQSLPSVEHDACLHLYLCVGVLMFLFCLLEFIQLSCLLNDHFESTKTCFGKVTPSANITSKSLNSLERPNVTIDQFVVRDVIMLKLSRFACLLVCKYEIIYV